jgi:hypothetical protein
MRCTRFGAIADRLMVYDTGDARDDFNRKWLVLVARVLDRGEARVHIRGGMACSVEPILERLGLITQHFKHELERG